MKETLSVECATRSEKRAAVLVRLGRGLCRTAAEALHKLRVPVLVAFATAAALTLVNLSAADSTTPSNEPAGALLGEKGAVDRIEFEGVTSFSREALRSALVRNAGFLLASHPQAPMDPFLETLRQKILAGYQQNGFPNATVTAALDETTGRVRVRVSEGVRYRCGKVQVAGVKPGPAAAIVARLTKPVFVPSKISEGGQSAGANASTGDNASQEVKIGVQTEVRVKVESRERQKALAATREPSADEPFWAPGEPGAFGEAATKQIEEAVKDCLAELGLFFPEVNTSVRLNLENHTADLLVQVLNEGPRGTVSELEVSGNEKNSRDDILKFLELKRGMAITRSRVSEAERKLWRSGRFVHYEITPEPAVSGLTKAGGVRLSIKVQELSTAPKLTARLSPEEQTLLRLCYRLEDFESGTEELAISWAFAGRENPFSLAGDLVVSPRQGALMKFKEPTTLGDTDYALLFARRTVGLYAAKRRYKLFVSQPDIASSVTVKLAPDAADAEHPFNFTLAAGCRHLSDADRKSGMVPPFRLNLELAPVAFLHILDLTNLVWQVKGRTLLLQTSNLVVRLETATGRLEELSFHGPQMSVEARFVKGAFEPARRDLDAASLGWSNRYDPQRPFSSMAGFVAVESARWRVFDKVVTNLPPVQRERAIAAVSQLLGASVLAPIDEATSATNQTESFTIPGEETDRTLAQNSLATFLAAFAFGWGNDFFPKYSWPWTVAHESVFVLANQATYTGAELQRLYASDDTGPVGFLVVAELLAKMNLPAAKTFADRGLTRLTAADFRSDCRLFLQDDCRLARAFSNMAVVLREMPPEDVAALAAALPADEAGLLEDCVQALRSAPTEPLAASLGSALDQYWVKSLRARVRAALQKLSATIPAPAGPRI
jgi:hypothetical protein